MKKVCLVKRTRFLYQLVSRYGLPFLSHLLGAEYFKTPSACEKAYIMGLREPTLNHTVFGSTCIAKKVNEGPTEIRVDLKDRLFDGRVRI